MNLILSKKAEMKLDKKGHLVEDFIPDIETWRIDCASLKKRSIFIITNEKTLYTYISSYRNNFNGILKKLTSTTIQDNLKLKDIDYVKFQNRNVVGSMNNMKKIISQLDKYYPSDNEKYENLINHTPFKYLSDLSPAEVHSRTPRLGP